jgi:hypothetical protein
MTQLANLATTIESLFAKQLTRISFHINQVENDYRANEHRLSTAMLDVNLTDQQHLEYARRVIALAEEYKQRFLTPLQSLRVEIQDSIVEFDRAFRALHSQIKVTEQSQIGSWLGLTHELAALRSTVTDAIGNNIDFDIRNPRKIIECNGLIDITLTAEESRSFRDDLIAYSEAIKGSYEREQEIDMQRDALTKALFPVNAAAQSASDTTPRTTPPLIHPLEGKLWFRLLKVVYFGLWIVGLGMMAIASNAESNFSMFVGGCCVIALILLVAKKLFYYITLGRTSAVEKPGQGFADIEELRGDLAGVRIDNPEVYERVVTPNFTYWEKRYGRRIPVHELRLLQGKVDRELDDIRAKRKALTDKAARSGATIDVGNLRSQLERSKAEYKGFDPAAYGEGLDRFLVSLEVKYGKAIPIDEAERLLSELETIIPSAQTDN